MKKMIYYIFAAIFIGACSAPLLGLLFGYKNENVEKRALAPAPVFFGEKGFNAAFPQEAEDYLSDHFAFKPQLVTADAFLRGALFGESVNEKVIIGKDGWLFFAPTLPDYLAVETLSDNDIYRVARTLEIQKEALARQGVGFIFVVAPNKASIYPEYMPAAYRPTGYDNNYDRLYGRLEGSGLERPDLRALLRGYALTSSSIPPIDPIYLKLDSHWNNKGALIAYRAVADALISMDPNLTLTDFPDIPFEKSTVRNGDLSIMLYPSTELFDVQYEYVLASAYTSARPIRSMEDILIRTSCEGGSGDILMFRDSFANAWIPFFSNAFATATYSRAIPYDYGLLTEETDAVVFEIVERNIANILSAAPLLSSYAVEAAPDVRRDDITLDCRLERTDDTLRLYGTAMPSDYDTDGYYEIYIRADGANGSGTFVTFPILEKEFLDNSDDPDTLARRANVAFSARLDLSAFVPGTYALTVIVHGPTGPVSAPIETIAVS